jgi:hypothetical protein
VDFRELIKRLANEFRIRVEMKQIGLRHESGLVGGIGSCGRELCCSTWLTDFKSVSTAAARYQNLSLNPMKISGQCGRLKCCLNYELETYMDALQDIPKADKIDTEAGMAFLQKTDIFKRIMWFSYKGETTWIPLEVDKVHEMLAMNQAGEKPSSLHAFNTQETEAAVDFVDVVGQATLVEEPRRRKKNKKRRKPNNKAQNQNQARSNARSSNRSGGRGKSNRKDGDSENQSGRKPQNRRNKRNDGGGGGSENNPRNQNRGGAGGGKSPGSNSGGGRRRGGNRGGRNNPRNDSKN